MNHHSYEVATVIVRHSNGALAMPFSTVPLSGIVTDEARPGFWRLFRWLSTILLPDTWATEATGETRMGRRRNVYLVSFSTAAGNIWAAGSEPVTYINAHEMREHAADLLAGADIIDARNGMERLTWEILEGGK